MELCGSHHPLLRRIAHHPIPPLGTLRWPPWYPHMPLIVININFRGVSAVIRPEMEAFTRWLADTARLHSFLHIADENEPPPRHQPTPQLRNRLPPPEIVPTNPSPPPRRASSGGGVAFVLKYHCRTCKNSFNLLSLRSN